MGEAKATDSGQGVIAGMSRAVPENRYYSDLPYPEAPEGIGGWLLLVLAHLVFNIKDSVQVLWKEPWSDWRGLFSGEAGELTGWPVLYAASAAMDIVIMVLALASLVLMTGKSTRAPKFIAAFYLSMMLACIVNGYLNWADDREVTGYLSDVPLDREIWLPMFGLSILVQSLMIGYVRRSKRVANTFRARQAPVEKLGDIFS